MSMSAKLIGAGRAAVVLAGAAVGVGLIFTAYNIGFSPYEPEGVQWGVSFAINRKKIKANSKIKSLVLFGSPHSIGTSLGFTISRAVKKGLTFTPFQRSAFIGLMMSDGNLDCHKNAKNALFRLTVGQTNFPFGWHCYLLFSPFCTSPPYISIGKYGIVTAFNTLSQPVITSFYRAFYPLKVKVVPEFIWMYMDPIMLAYWLMGDGQIEHGRDGGVVLCTDSFTEADNVRLISMLIYFFNLDCTLRGNNRIYIKTNSMARLADLVRPYMVPHFMYKLGKYA